MQTTKPPSLDGTTTAEIKAQRERDFERGIFSTNKPTHGTFYLAPFFATKWFATFCSHDFEHWQSLNISVLVRLNYRKTLVQEEEKQILSQNLTVYTLVTSDFGSHLAW